MLNIIVKDLFEKIVLSSLFLKPLNEIMRIPDRDEKPKFKVSSSIDNLSRNSLHREAFWENFLVHFL